MKIKKLYIVVISLILLLTGCGNTKLNLEHLEEIYANNFQNESYTLQIRESEKLSYSTELNQTAQFSIAIIGDYARIQFVVYIYEFKDSKEAKKLDDWATSSTLHKHWILHTTYYSYSDVSYDEAIVDEVIAIFKNNF